MSGQRFVCEKYETPYEEGYRAITTLEEHDKQIREEVIDDYVKKFCDKDNQAKFIVLNRNSYSWNSYAKHVAEQLKEQNK